MSTENKKEPLLFFNESRVGLPYKWKSLKIAEASIPMVVALNLPDNIWYEIKVTVKKKPDGTMLCRSVGALVAWQGPLDDESPYPVFKLNSEEAK